MRSLGFRSFPYRAFFVMRPRLVVVAFARDARRPGYCASRLRDLGR